MSLSSLILFSWVCFYLVFRWVRMEFSFEDHRIVVIGCVDTLGYTCAEVLASEGASLALLDNDLKALKNVTNQLRNHHEVSVSSHAGDMSDPVWRESVVEVLSPADHILFNATRYVFPEPSNKRSTKSNYDLSHSDIQRLIDVLEFIKLLIENQSNNDDKPVFISLLGSSSYVTYGKESQLDDSIYWSLFQDTLASFSKKLDSFYDIRSIHLKVTGDVPLNLEAEDFEVRVADTVTTLISDFTVISGSQIELKKT